MTRTQEYRVLHGVVRHTFIIYGLFTTANLCPLAQHPGDATGEGVPECPNPELASLDDWAIGHLGERRLGDTRGTFRRQQKPRTPHSTHSLTLLPECKTYHMSS